MSFDTLGLAPVLLAAIKRANFTQATPVQNAAIPKALEGRDLIVTAQTGSGKTAAFMLPALHKMATQEHKKEVQMLVLTPTRELALQVAEATKTLSYGMKNIHIATVVGGMPYGAQIKALSRHVDILVATPGRLLDHLQAKHVKLSSIHSLVLDEADRMLDMGFIDDIKKIVAQTSTHRQTLMFSATFEGSVARLAQEMLNNPERISIADQTKKHDNITQSLLYADDHGHKFRLLDHLLRDANLDQAIIFTATKRGADDLAERLDDAGFAVDALHGDMNQRQRTRTLNALQRGRIQILVATDVAARGIDVHGITHAINYDLPMQAEDYVHRIGRTGRAGRNGLAFTLATHSERFKVRRIEQFIGQTIETTVIPGLEPSGKPVKKSNKDRGKPSRDKTPARHKNAARDGFAHRKGMKENTQPRRASDLDKQSPFTPPSRTRKADARPVSRLAFVEKSAGHDFEILSPREAKSIKRSLGKDEQPKFSDFERGARSKKAKYNKEATSTAKTSPKAKKVASKSRSTHDEQTYTRRERPSTRGTRQAKAPTRSRTKRSFT